MQRHRERHADDTGGGGGGDDGDGGDCVDSPGVLDGSTTA
jgi:hypothetical protein